MAHCQTTPVFRLDRIRYFHMLAHHANLTDVKCVLMGWHGQGRISDNETTVLFDLLSLKAA
jgi:hypothetical protein